ncbi:AMP-binding protein [Kordia zhangzhouensis]|uniref:AMP-binding protein n=1 Tax=Kordia zhangzhouensis TaxID=1620405 RepID=UPI000629B4AB|nr:class I adenylate-forming enzyme family protein [Kordia zhangzhouensis]
MQLQTLLQHKNPNVVYLHTEKAAYTYADMSAFVVSFTQTFLEDTNEVIALKINDQALLMGCIWACIQHAQSFVVLPFQTTPVLEKALLSEALCDLVVTSKEILFEKLDVRNLTTYHIKVQTERPKRKHISKIGFVSSGTTGTPKLIWNTFAQFETSLECISKEQLMPYCKQQHVLLTPFLTHSYGFSAMLEYTLGNSIIYLPSEASFAGLFRLLAKKEIQAKITAVEGVPYLYSQLLVLQQKIRFPNVQHLGFGGEFVHDVLLQTLHDLYPKASYAIRYGISEIPSVIALNTFTTLEENTHSYEILPCYSITIDEEMVVHSKELFTPIYTGDVGYVKNDRLHIEGRYSSFIKVKGYKVSPTYVENALLNSQMTQEAHVFLKNDTLIAYVISTEKVDKVALKTYLRNQLPPYAVPDIIKEVESISRTSTGKINRQSNERTDI